MERSWASPACQLARVRAAIARLRAMRWRPAGGGGVLVCQTGRRWRAEHASRRCSGVPVCQTGRRWRAQHASSRCSGVLVCQPGRRWRAQPASRQVRRGARGYVAYERSESTIASGKRITLRCTDVSRCAGLCSCVIELRPGTGNFRSLRCDRRGDVRRDTVRRTPGHTRHTPKTGPQRGPAWPGRRRGRPFGANCRPAGTPCSMIGPLGGKLAISEATPNAGRWSI